MAKLVTTDIANITGAESTAISNLNANWDAIEAAMENTLSRDGTTPNTMSADFDLNTNDLLNGGNVNCTALYIGGNLVEPATLGNASALLAALLTVDGAGSGLDADLLDGLSSTAFGQLAGTNTWTAAQTFSAAASFNDDVTITSTDAGATANPTLKLYRNSASPAVNDIAGELIWSGKNDAAQEWNLARLFATITDETDTTEDSRLTLELMVAGTLRETMTFEGYSFTVQDTVSSTSSVISSGSIQLNGASDTGTFTDSIINLGSNGAAFGSASGPQYSFTNDTDTGIYHAGANVIGMATAGLEYARLSAGAFQVNSYTGDATVGPDLITKRASGSPAASDLLGRLLFIGKDAGANDHNYAAIRAQIQDTTDTSEDGSLDFLTSQAGTLTNQATLTETGVFDLLKGQLKFPATQNASSDANTLDDYQEGTWTPGISFGGGTTGITYSDQTGSYIKIGRFIIAVFNVTLSAKGSSTGTMRITGLPETVSAQSGLSVGLAVSFTGLTGALVGYGSGSTIVLQEWGATGTANIDDTNATATTRIYGSIVYTTSN